MPKSKKNKQDSSDPIQQDNVRTSDPIQQK